MLDGKADDPGADNRRVLTDASNARGDDSPHMNAAFHDHLKRCVFFRPLQSTGYRIGARHLTAVFARPFRLPGSKRDGLVRSDIGVRVSTDASQRVILRHCGVRPVRLTFQDLQALISNFLQSHLSDDFLRFHQT
jgi:hypothetical protein